jgi:two-component system, NtrC family, sensor kinase
MLSFRNLPLRRKQTAIITLTSGIVLLFACAAFVAYDTLTFRRELVENVSVLAEAIGNNCSAALDFDDVKAATETLAALHANDNIVYACVYSPDGHVFAVYKRDPGAAFVPPPVQPLAQAFIGQQLHLFRPIMQRGALTGTIFVESDLKDLSARLIRYFGIVAVVFLASLLVAFALSSKLQRLVSDPILLLARVARSVATKKDYSVRATKQSDDELGQLVDGFNDMLAQIQARDNALRAARDTLEKRVEERTLELEDTHAQLVEASRRGGMAEIATNVLHNVGNVLNSVNISTGLLLDSVKHSRVSSLARVAALLKEHAHDLGSFITEDPRGKHVPEHLSQLSEHLIAEQNVVGGELESLRRNVDHIKEIVAMQQNYATVGGVKETIDLLGLVKDSIRINEASLSRHSVKIVRDFAPVPPMNVEKHKILQILVNLVRNAQHACQASERADGQLTVRVTCDAAHVRISVIDNGIGVAHDSLARIFSHGFTTWHGGHGFGLHSGALAAKELGGSLTVQSDGPGRGAAFTLELPCAAADNIHA